MSFVKIITESMKDRPNNKIEESLSLEQLDDLISKNTNRLIEIKTKYDEVKSTWASLTEDYQSFSFGNTLNVHEMKEHFQKAIDDLKMDYRDTKTTLNTYKEQKNKLLLESEELKKENPLKEKNTPILECLKDMINKEDTYTIFEYLFDSLVPHEGKAESKAGELLRALMKILFSAYKDNKVYYDPNCPELNIVAEYVKKNCGDDCDDNFLNIEDGALQGDDYLSIMESVLDKSFRYIAENPDGTLFLGNTSDCTTAL